MILVWLILAALVILFVYGGSRCGRLHANDDYYDWKARTK